MILIARWLLRLPSCCLQREPAPRRPRLSRRSNWRIPWIFHVPSNLFLLPLVSFPRPPDAPSPLTFADQLELRLECRTTILFRRIRFHETHFPIRSSLICCSTSFRHGLRYRTRHRSRSAAQACTRRHRHAEGQDFQLRSNCTNRCKRRISLRRGSTWRISRNNLRRFLLQ